MHFKELAGVHLQRSDLRRTRMELAAATEEANQTRQELRVVRAELSRSRVAQATVSFPTLHSVYNYKAGFPSHGFIFWKTCNAAMPQSVCHN